MRTLPAGLFLCMLSGAVVIDRIAVVVDRHVIKASDVDRDLRVTEFLNREPVTMNGAVRKAAAERLIDQEIIRSDIASGGYGRASEKDADALLSSVRKERFGDSEARLRQALAAYGLTEYALRAQMTWQLTVLKFIDERFRAGVLVSEEDVRGYYDRHRANFSDSFENAGAGIRKNLEGEQVNRQFETWLSAARKLAVVQYREAAFQ
jgi:hypothetical protein